MLLYIIRHGEPDYSTDTLTARGKLQAEAVAKRMVDSKINVVYSSPMGRAKETAEPTCRLLGLSCNIENWMQEIDEAVRTPFPDGVRKSVSNMQKTYFRENENILLPYEKSFECQGIKQSGMKKATEYIERNGNKFCERLGYKEENGVYRILRKNEDRIAVFCHGAFSRAWMSSLFHIPLHLLWASTEMTHTGVTVIEFKNYENGITSPVCLCFSDMSHLYANNLDMKYCNGVEV